MTYSSLIEKNILSGGLYNSHLIFRSISSGNFGKFCHLNSFSSRPRVREEKVLEKYGSYSNFLLKKEIEDRESSLKKETVAKYLKKLKARESNLSKPALLYEGPVYLNYWMRRRRSGARK